MPNTARRIDPLPPIAVPHASAAVAQGGPVAGLHRAIGDRLAMGELLPMSSVPLLDRIASGVSRALGFATLAVAYAATATWFLG